MWNGTAPSLNPRPATMNTSANASTTSRVPRSATTAASRVISSVPAAP
jgi:hypothetical protein